MEKLPEEEEKGKQFSKSSSARYSDSSLWDCGSTLYDSFELNSFKRQLNSAIANSSHRSTLSMSHLPEQTMPAERQQQPSRKSYKISLSFQKFLRSVFKSNNKSNVSSTTANTSFHQVPQKYSKDRFYVLYDKSGPVLSTIPEGPDFEISPEISSLVKRSASERFTTTTTTALVALRVKN